MLVLFYYNNYCSKNQITPPCYGFGHAQFHSVVDVLRLWDFDHEQIPGVEEVWILRVIKFYGLEIGIDWFIG